MRLKKFNEFKSSINESVADVEDEIWDVKQELSDLSRERKDLLMDMENEAGQKGEDWSDEDGNRYGAMLNDLDEKEIELRKKIEQLHDKLDEEEKREFVNTYVDSFRNILEEVSDPSEFEYKISDDNSTVAIEVGIGEDEFEFGITSTGDLFLKELEREISLGDPSHDEEDIKKFLLKIFSLDGEEYTDFISSFNDGDDFDKDEDETEEDAEEQEKEIPHMGDDEDLSDQEGVIADEEENEED